MAGADDGPGGRGVRLPRHPDGGPAGKGGECVDGQGSGPRTRESGDGPGTEGVVVSEVVVPPVVYVPVESVPEGEEADVIFRRTRDGEVALVLYTALDRLVDCCGPHQPWILMPTEKLAAVAEVQPYDLIFFDLEMPEEERVRPADA